MKTEIINVTYENLNMELIKKAGLVIRQGGLVAFPTETVYGLGGDGLNPDSSKKIYQAKGRPSDNPLIIHIADFDALAPIVADIPEKALLLARKFWPGPLTMVFERSDIVPVETTGGLNTIAVRMPSDAIALAFIREAGGYVAAPSANRSGRPSPTSSKYVVEDMNGRIDMILDGGEESQIGIESTILDMTTQPPCILRPGYITKAMLEEEIGTVETDQTIFSNRSDLSPKAPGMKYRHYAPKGTMVLLEGKKEAVIEYINNETDKKLEQGFSVGIIGTDETMNAYTAGFIKSVGKRTDERMIARRLYLILREFDDENIQYIYSESFEGDGIGQAIMNRLLKAAGHSVIKLP